MWQLSKKSLGLSLIGLSLINKDQDIPLLREKSEILNPGKSNVNVNTSSITRKERKKRTKKNKQAKKQRILNCKK